MITTIHTDTTRHFIIDLMAAEYILQIERIARAHTETSNRSFGQMIRQHRERMERVMLEQENMGDEDLLCCSGIRWGMSDD